MKLIIMFLCGFAASIYAFAQTNPPALSAIKEADLKKDLYELAAAKYKGRSAGTIDELKAAMWVADKYREIGLKPGGDDGTYFQFFNMWRNVLADRSTIAINNKSFQLWKDVAVATPANVAINAPLIYLGNAGFVDTTADVEGKVVVIEANNAGINMSVSLPTWRYHRYIYSKHGQQFVSKGAAAIVFISDETGELTWNDAVENYKLGSFDIEGGANENVITKVPVLWVHAAAKSALQQRGATLIANLVISKFSYPSVNIIGTVAGTDKNLQSGYLLYSGHTDAHGIRNNIKGDTIYYGADDNASVNVAMLANARAFVAKPGKRPVVFVVHGAEERGLLGSRYYVAHPTIPLNNIVAVLNGDMIGRNTNDSAAVLGVQPPHRTSMDLVKMVMQANNEGPKFNLDTLWDKPSHVEGWYFRSDHLPYARLGIPSIMYTTLLHADYHTPQDNAENINYPKLLKMAKWMYRTGWKVANAPKRLTREANFALER